VPTAAASQSTYTHICFCSPKLSLLASFPITTPSAGSSESNERNQMLSPLLLGLKGGGGMGSSGTCNSLWEGWHVVHDTQGWIKETWRKSSSRPHIERRFSLNLKRGPRKIASIGFHPGVDYFDIQCAVRPVLLPAVFGAFLQPSTPLWKYDSTRRHRGQLAGAVPPAIWFDVLNIDATGLRHPAVSHSRRDLSKWSKRRVPVGSQQGDDAFSAEWINPEEGL